MSESQPYGFSCAGGLNKNLSQFQLMAAPGFARELVNFEVKPDGGYRRINGFSPFGAGDATRPAGDTTILGIHVYALGIVVVAGTGIYYSENGIAWIQVNKDNATAGLTEANLASEAALARTAQSKAQFARMTSVVGDTDNPYGSLSIATGGDGLAHFTITGTGASRTFKYVVTTTPTAAKLIELHSRALVVVDSTNEPSTVVWSAVGEPTDFTSGTTGAVGISDIIVGIKSFRNELFIFCQNSIHKLLDIHGDYYVERVTRNIGCVSGESIQEIGGDLIYLAPDGFRTIAGTTRIGDVELSSVSRGIQPLLEDVTSDVSTYVVSSTVIRDKSQYRFFYSVDGGTATAAKGVIGTLGAEGFQWSELQGIAVAAITSDFDSAGEEVYYHGTEDGYIHLHDIGNSFNGSNILAKYRTSNLDFGDLGTLKTLKYVKISITPEGTVQPHLRVRFDYDSSDVAQPDDIVLDSIPAASVFGTAIFGVDIFGAVSDPIIRQTLEGSGHTSSYEIFSDDTRAPYTVNGMYINYDPSGRY